MKKIFLSFFAVAFAAVCGFTQTTILDFQTPATSTTFQYFGSTLDNTLSQTVANPDPTGINTSTLVSNFVKPAGAQTWAGAFSNPNPTTAVTVTGGALIKIKVRMNHIGNLALKLEQSNSGQPDWIKIVANTQINQWQELTFNCALPSDEGPNQVPTGTFARVVLFFDFGVPGTAVDVTSHFDEMIVSGGAPPPTIFPINFAVDMSLYGGSFTNVYVSGNLNGWSGNANPLSDPDGDQIWTGTINLASGNYEYKFTLDNWSGQEQFAGGEPCTITDPSGQFINRALSVTAAATLTQFCFNSCAVCSAPNPIVNFEVNMNNYTGSFTNVYVSGIFNGWSGNANPLTDADGDGIWTASISMPSGQYEYKVTLDNWANQEQFLGTEECTMTTGPFTNRKLLVSSGGTTAQFCFNSCYLCGEEVKMTFKLGMGNVVPNPAGVWLAGGGNFEAPGGRYRMTDGNNDGIYEIVVPRHVGFGSYFTFANGPCPDYSCKENLAGFPCGNPNNYNDRYIPAVSADTVYATCFGQCSDNAQCTYPALSPVFTTTNVLCNGGTNGAILTNVTGGSTFYSYNWGGGIITGNRSNLAAGTYTVTITDVIAQQTNVQNVVVNQPDLLLPVTTVTDVDCFGNATGSIIANANGGTANYSFVWENGATGGTRTGLLPGNYSVTITDANNCSTSTTQSITQPTEALSAYDVPVNVDCFGNQTGTILIVPSGGTSDYTYNWSNNATTQNIYDLPAGNYSATITDARNCTTTISEIILQPASALSVSATVTNPICGNANGSILLNVSGGTTGYSFNWGGGITTQNRVNLLAGTYSATVTDANACSTIITKTLNSTASSLAASAVSTNVACFGNTTGTINLTVNNGVAPLSFNWGNGVISQNRTGLSAGIYGVTVTDANNCTTTLSRTITEPASAVVSVATTINVACFGNQTGAIQLSTNGGTAPFSYNWGNGVISQNRVNLSAGIYIATISDANGCEITVSSNITQPNAALAASAATSNVACFGNQTGSISLGVSGGTAGYSFDWGGGITSQNRTNLAAGTYAATVTDNNGCTTFIERTITQPIAALVASATASDISCNGNTNGTAFALANGGNGGFNYVWTNGAITSTISNLEAGTYIVTVSDAQNCLSTASVTISQPTLLVCTASATAQTANGLNNGSASAIATGGTPNYTFLWSNGEITSTISNLAPGAYGVIVTDANGCTTAQTVTVNGFNCSLVSSISGTNISCFGANNGSATVNLQGAIAPISYIWNNGGTTATVAALSAGTYLVQVLDANGCPATLNIDISEPTQLAANATVSAQTASGVNDGSATANPTGGSNTYSYLWSNGSTNVSISGLSPDNYTVVVTDGNGCSATQTLVVAAFGCALQADFSAQNVTCAGAANGQIAINLVGGNNPVSYSWSNGQSTQTISGLSGGVYAVIISDGSGCQITLSANISEPTALNSLISGQINTLCPDDASGEATVNATGGSLPLSYLWSNGSTNATATNLLPGLQSVVVSDANGCTSTASVTILAIDNQAPVVICPATITRCMDQSTVVYQYPFATDNCSISNGTFTFVSGLPSGAVFPIGVTTQTFTFTDGSGNVGSCAFDVKVQSAAVVGSFTASGCFQSCEGAISAANITGGQAPYFYNWSNNQAGSSVSGLCNTNVNLVVTDNSGCSTAQTFNLTVPAVLVIAPPTVVNDLNNQNLGSINITVTGGVGPFSFKWTKNGNNFAITEDITNLGAGDYSVVVSDANGCDVAVQNVIVTNLVGTNEPNWAKGVKMIPNPTAGQVQLFFTDFLKKELEISMFDATGRIVTQVISNNEQVIDLDFSHLPTGVYSLRMRSEKEVGVRILVIQR
jgi:Secretion system C-terminal sorting domain/SprB repeat/HYR domain